MRMFFVIPQQDEGSEDGAGLIVFDPHRWQRGSESLQGSDVQSVRSFLSEGRKDVGSEVAFPLPYRRRR